MNAPAPYPPDPAAGVDLTDKAREMLDIVVDWQLSGKSLRAFCAERGLKAGTVAWWKKRLVDAGVDLDACVAWRRARGGTDVHAESVEVPVGAIPVVDDPAAEGLDRPALYLNRELTWLSFCRRVLAQAGDARAPLLARVWFLSIVGSNLDEFLMKRLGGLKQQAGAGIHEPSVDGRTPEEQIVACLAELRAIRSKMAEVMRSLFAQLRPHGIEIVQYGALDRDTQARLRQHYVDNIYPLVTPQAVDPAHPFPFVSNLSLNLLVTLTYPDSADPPSLARVKVPTGAVGRLVRVDEDADRFVLLEDLMAHNLDLLFPGMKILSCEFFRVVRNANTERDEDKADDLLAMIESELRDRRFAPIVALMCERTMDPVRRGMLAAELGLDEALDVFDMEGMLGMRDLAELARIDRPGLHFPKHQPVDHPDLVHDDLIFHEIRRVGSILLAHPFQAFATSVDRFLREASADPKVLAIKMTLYRTAEDSRIIDHLVNAARNGKQVAVVVELKARFDEAANIRWANRLEEAGIHVTYGVVGLKTHCKVTVVVRRDYNGLRRYVHIGTGNYHAGTARAYTDLGLLTADDAVGAGVTELFNYLTTGYKPKRDYGPLLVAPKHMKKKLLALIDGEIAHHARGRPAGIQIKCNALEDADVTRALYRAGQAGVPVDLVVRDTCRLRPGLDGLSASIRVLSIVGRFLEHSRIYRFERGGKPAYYIGSADLMKRNLESRVELLCPIKGKEHKQTLQFILDTLLADNRLAWDMQPDGSYAWRRPAEGEEERNSQEQLIAWAEARTAEATRLRKRRPKGLGRRRRN